MLVRLYIISFICLQFEHVLPKLAHFYVHSLSSIHLYVYFHSPGLGMDELASSQSSMIYWEEESLF